MRIAQKHVGNVSIANLKGRLTIGEGDVKLKAKVGRLLEDGHVNILLNLNKVSYIDSTGLGELVACQKRTKEKGGIIKLLKPSKKVQDLLILVKLSLVFEIFNDEKEAVASF